MRIFWLWPHQPCSVLVPAVTDDHYKAMSKMTLAATWQRETETTHNFFHGLWSLVSLALYKTGRLSTADRESRFRVCGLIILKTSVQLHLPDRTITQKSWNSCVWLIVLAVGVCALHPPVTPILGPPPAAPGAPVPHYTGRINCVPFAPILTVMHGYWHDQWEREEGLPAPRVSLGPAACLVPSRTLKLPWN